MWIDQRDRLGRGMVIGGLGLRWDEKGTLGSLVRLLGGRERFREVVCMGRSGLPPEL